MSLLKRLFSKTYSVDKDNPVAESIFETHKDKIYPWVKAFFTGDDDSRNTPIQIELKSEEAPIKKDWLGDLGILYVADTGNSFRVLYERDLPKDVTKDQLHQLAVDNLKRDIQFNLRGTSSGVHGLIAGGNHEAASLCLPDLWVLLADQLHDNLIVGVPTKDLVIMVPENDAGKIASLKIFVHDIFKNGERLLTKNIFKFDRESREWRIIDRVI